MLPKSNRLSKDLDIKRAYRTRFCSQDKFVKIYLKKNTNLSFQLLVVVGKKVFKKANKRNRIKRKIYGIFDQLMKFNRLPNTISCIIQVNNKDILLQTEPDLKIHLTNSLSSLYLKLQPQPKNI